MVAVCNTLAWARANSRNQCLPILLRHKFNPKLRLSNEMKAAPYWNYVMSTPKRLPTIKPSVTSETLAAGARLFAIGALVMLSACAAIDPLATPIGDPQRPLMAPGEGAIANSLAYLMPIHEFAQLGPLITDIQLQVLDGGRRSLGFGNGRGVPKLVAKLPHAKNATPPYIFIHSLKPGKYRLNEIVIGASYTNMQNFGLRNAPEITVVAGQITYVGSFFIEYDTKFNKGDLVIRYAKLAGPNNEFERDMGQLKLAEKRLEHVVISNALVP